MRLIIRPSPGNRAAMESLKRLQKKTQEACEKAAGDVAKEGAKYLRDVIYNQKFTPLAMSDFWRRRKAQLGLDPRVLIATGRYVSSIKARQLAKTTWQISGLEPYASWGEYGVNTAPPKPHWALLEKWIAKNAQRLLRKYLNAK